MDIIQYMIILVLVYLVIRNKDKSYLIKDTEKCIYCGKKIDPDFLYCPYCQEELKKKCDSCGKLIYSDWRYCPYCEEKTYKDKEHIIETSKIIGDKK